MSASVKVFRRRPRPCRNVCDGRRLKTFTPGAHRVRGTSVTGPRERGIYLLRANALNRGGQLCANTAQLDDLNCGAFHVQRRPFILSLALPISTPHD
jgi:hypothetical protein